MKENFPGDSLITFFILECFPFLFIKFEDERESYNEAPSGKFNPSGNDGQARTQDTILFLYRLIA